MKYYFKLAESHDIPTVEDEADRDLIRARAHLVDQFKRLKRFIVSVCKRYSISYRTETSAKDYFTTKHMNWLVSKIKTLENMSLKINLETLLSSYNQLETTISFYDLKIKELSLLPKYKEKVDSLVCYRGLETLSAMTIITELGDIKRFCHPKKLCSYLGFDIRESSSGGKEKKKNITKMGNHYVRTAIIEANQYSFMPVKVSRWLTKRRMEINPKYVEIADRCMHRQSEKGRRLLARGKIRNKAKVACAREMVGFIWESLIKATRELREKEKSANTMPDHAAPNRGAVCEAP